MSFIDRFFDWMNSLAMPWRAVAWTTFIVIELGGVGCVVWKVLR